MLCYWAQALKWHTRACMGPLALMMLGQTARLHMWFVGPRGRGFSRGISDKGTEACPFVRGTLGRCCFYPSHFSHLLSFLLYEGATMLLHAASNPFPRFLLKPPLILTKKQPKSRIFPIHIQKGPMHIAKENSSTEPASRKASRISTTF